MEIFFYSLGIIFFVIIAFIVLAVTSWAISEKNDSKKQHKYWDKWRKNNR